MQNKQEKKYFYWLLLLAFIINLIIIYFVLIVHFDTGVWQNVKRNMEEAPIFFEDMPDPLPEDKNSEGSIQQEQTETQPKSHEVAALVSRASVFGATDIVQDEPEFMKGATDSWARQSVSDSDIYESEQAGVDDPLLLDVIDPLATSVDTVSIPNILEDAIDAHLINESTGEMQKSLEDKTRGDAPDQVAEIGAQEVVTNKSELSLPENIPDTPSDKVTSLQQKQSNADMHRPLRKKRRRKKSTRDNTGKGTKNASPIKKELTLAHLANGFLELVGQGGQDWMDREGNKDIRPELAEMKQLSYLQRVYWHLQNECKINSIVFNPAWRLPIETAISLSINAKGDITNLFVSSPSGYSEFDEKVKIVLQKASPCPSIPAFLGLDKIIITFTYRALASHENMRIRYSSF